MGTFDQLSDEQRAIVELVLQQGKSYDELSDLLGLPERRVRELARDALVDLAPLSARSVEQDWRGQLADYVLGQQAGPEATATRGHLRRSEAARSWTRSLLDSLEQLYSNGDLPAIPEGERGRERGAKRAGALAAPGPQADGEGAGRRPPADDPVKHRRMLAGAGAVALLLVAVLVWPIGVLTGSGDDEPSQASSGDGSGEGQASGDGAAAATKREGSAIIAEQEGKTQILVTAAGLEPSTERSAYQVWLYNSDQDRKSLGATVTDPQGQMQSGTALPADYQDYEFIDLTAVTVTGQGQNQRFKTGASVLRGLLELREQPVTRGTGKERLTLLADIRMSPVLAGG